MRLLGATATLAMCAMSAQAERAPAQTDRIPPGIAVSIRGRALQVHLAAAATGQSGPLIVYATGDGGWPGDERLFDRMLPFGLPMAGFSSVDYIESINTPNRMIDPAAVARDYQTVITGAIEALKLPKDQPVVLVGFSRGASLAVAAATVPAFRARLLGVVALALAGDEVFVSRLPSDSRPLQTDDAVRSLGPVKVSVIQSTRDDILSAAEARRRVGPDTPTRRLRAIDARDHNFGGKLDELITEVKRSLDWFGRRESGPAPR